jgi:hypothetical protein
MATNTISYMTAAVDIVRRFLAPAAQHLCAAIWLMGQCNVFVRNRELLAREPFSITADEPFVEELTELVTRLAMAGCCKPTQQCDYQSIDRLSRIAHSLFAGLGPDPRCGPAALSADRQAQELINALRDSCGRVIVVCARRPVSG